jgi:hypothetical protein
MPMGNYSDLENALSVWLGGRSDLTTYVSLFVQMFEATCNRRLRVREMENLVALTTTDGVGSLPTGYLGWRNVWWQGSQKRLLEWVHPSYYTAEWPTVPSGCPIAFTITDGSIYIAPTDDTATYGLEYYLAIPSLEIDGTNWLFTEHPDVYLYGALAESAALTQDDNALAKWIARRDKIFQEIEDLDKRDGKFASIKILGPTP